MLKSTQESCIIFLGSRKIVADSSWELGGFMSLAPRKILAPNIRISELFTGWILYIWLSTYTFKSFIFFFSWYWGMSLLYYLLTQANLELLSSKDYSLPQPPQYSRGCRFTACSELLVRCYCYAGEGDLGEFTEPTPAAADTRCTVQFSSLQNLISTKATYLLAKVILMPS